MPGSSDVIYSINERDEIVSVNSAYDEFALDNHGIRVASTAVLGRPLWDFVVDPTTLQIYREAVRRVRSGGRACFTFRCDSPTRRRLMQMTMVRDGDGVVQFRVRTVATEDRASVLLLASDAPRSPDLLPICGWCKKVSVGDRWMEVEDAVGALHLFERRVVPALTHGICDPCREAVVSELAQP